MKIRGSGKKKSDHTAGGAGVTSGAGRFQSCSHHAPHSPHSLSKEQLCSLGPLYAGSSLGALQTRPPLCTLPTIWNCLCFPPCWSLFPSVSFSCLVFLLFSLSLLRPIVEGLNGALQELFSGTLSTFFKPLFAHIQLTTHISLNRRGTEGKQSHCFSKIWNIFPNVRPWSYISHTIRLHCCQKALHHQ